MNATGTYPFTFVVPTVVNDFNLVSTSVPEDDHPLYLSSTTYSVGDKVVISTGYHKIYQSLEDDNLNNFPPDNPLSWVEVGPTNAWAMFDGSGGTRTMATSSLTFKVSADRLDTLAFLGVIGASIRVVAEDQDEEVYFDNTYTNNDTAPILNWFQYFFTPVQIKTELTITDIPPVGGSTFTITISADGPVGLENFVMGRKEEYGKTQYGATAGIIDYSRKDVDQFGTAKLVRRRFSKRMDVQLWLEKVETDFLYRRLVDLRATPVLWIGARDQYELLTIYGFYRDFGIDIAYPSVNYCTLQIEGLS